MYHTHMKRQHPHFPRRSTSRQYCTARRHLCYQWDHLPIFTVLLTVEQLWHLCTALHKRMPVSLQWSFQQLHHKPLQDPTTLHLKSISTTPSLHQFPTTHHNHLPTITCQPDLLPPTTAEHPSGKTIRQVLDPLTLS